jgi:uncharacterized protein (TIGR00299 family) protein
MRPLAHSILYPRFMKIAYGDLIGGVSGDMFVAALLDSGLPLPTLKSALKKIPSLKFDVEVKRKLIDSVSAAQFRVSCGGKEPARSWKQIRHLIESSSLDAAVKATGIKIFSRLAAAEGKIHAIAPERVHFHEVGATDSIVDIMAAAIGIHELGIDTFHFSPVPVGRGIITSKHGRLPAPGPATLELLRGIPAVGVSIEGETVTPTGAAIVSALGQRFGNQPPMTIEKIGYGAGEKIWPDRPNLFRIVLGSDTNPWKEEAMLVIETNIDDMNPAFYDYILDRLFAAGARDVFLSSIQMKKNRPGTLLRIIAEPGDRQEIAKILFEETSTIGVRFYPVGRMILNRSVATVKTKYGNVRLKVVEAPDGTKRASPEYDDLKRIAAAKKVPLKAVHDDAMLNFKP